MKNTDKDERLTETQVMQQLTDPVDYSDKKEENTFTETRVLEELTDPDCKKSSHKEPEEKPEKPHSALNELFSFVIDLIVCMAIILVVTNFVVRPVQVSGDSMYPTLKDKSFGVSDVLGYNLNGIERFDVAIIYLPEKDEYLVKRVIGLPGETVSYSNGQLYINNEPVEEPFLDQSYVESYGDYFMSDVAPITLGEDEYYCLGDNRPASSDSRYYGPFKKENIRSKGIFIFWPFSKFGAQTW